MQVKPKTEKEIAEANLWPAGIYDFEIIEAEEATSKNDRDMIAMRVRVYHPDGSPATLRDWLVDDDRMAYKVRHCAEACGLLVEYEKGVLLARDLMGRTGKCKVGIQKDRNGQYPDRNSISDYVVGEKAGNAPAPAARKVAPIDDEIPF